MNLIWNIDPTNTDVQESKSEKYDFFLYFSGERNGWVVEVEFEGNLVESLFSDSEEGAKEETTKWNNKGVL